MADDWKKKWDESGYYFSEDDRMRAEYDPQFRDQIYQAKDLYARGDTEAGHSMAESARRAYNYSGGVAGDKYIASPIRTDTSANMISDVTQRMAAYDKYLDPLEGGLMGKYQAIADRQPFSYDYKTDPAYQAYAKEYAREGRRASEDTLAQAAAMTGGIPSSYAQTAAQQAGNYYSARLADKIPELYKLAYEMYADEASRNMSELGALRGYSSDLYGRWGDEFSRLGTLYGVGAKERGYEDEKDASKLYAYGDGEPYEIGSGKGQYFVMNSRPGDSMVGGDGSVWQNVDGQITISRGDKTWSIGEAAAPKYYYGGGGKNDDEDDSETIPVNMGDVAALGAGPISAERALEIAEARGYDVFIKNGEWRIQKPQTPKFTDAFNGRFPGLY